MVRLSLQLICVLVMAASALVASSQQGHRCQTMSVVSKKIEKDIDDCQGEIKLSILQEALDALGVPNRRKRDTLSADDRRIAGCLLQCVYRKVKAVDLVGYPTREGLVRLYTEGITENGYYEATAQVVQQCLVAIYQHRLATVPLDGKGTCDIAYDSFECISDRIAQYCES